MKKLILIFTLLVSTVMFSSPSYAEWTEVTKNKKGMTFYVDFERIRKHDGYIYYWNLSDYLKPNRGYFSDQKYEQGDCKLFRFKILSATFHKVPMGGGNGENQTNAQGWIYPPPNSIIEKILKSVCSR
jgi:hypothetical protein